MESGAAITVIRTCNSVSKIYAIKQPLSNFMIEAAKIADKLATDNFKEYRKDHSYDIAKCITEGVMAYVAIERITNCSSVKVFDESAMHTCNVYAVNTYDQYNFGYGIGAALDDIMTNESVLTGDSTNDITEYAGVLLYALRYIVVNMQADLSIIDEAIARRRADVKTLENLEG